MDNCEIKRKEGNKVFKFGGKSNYWDKLFSKPLPALRVPIVLLVLPCSLVSPGYANHSSSLFFVLPGPPWFSLVLHGSPWFSQVLPGSPWFSLVLPDSSWFSLVLSSSPWFSLVLSSSPWFSLVLPGSPWFSLVPPGSL